MEGDNERERERDRKRERERERGKRWNEMRISACTRKCDDV